MGGEGPPLTGGREGLTAPASNRERDGPPPLVGMRGRCGREGTGVGRLVGGSRVEEEEEVERIREKLL